MSETKLLRLILKRLTAIQTLLEEQKEGMTTQPKPPTESASKASTDTVTLKIGRLRERKSYRACSQCFRAVSEEKPCVVHNDTKGRELDFRVYDAVIGEGAAKGTRIMVSMPPWLPKTAIQDKTIRAQGRWRTFKGKDNEFTIVKILESRGND